MDFERLTRACGAFAGATAFARSEEFQRLSDATTRIVGSIRASGTLAQATVFARSEEFRRLSDAATRIERSIGASGALAKATAFTRSEEFRRLSDAATRVERSIRASGALAEATAFTRSEEFRRLSDASARIRRSIGASGTLAQATAFTRSEEFRRQDVLGAALALGSKHRAIVLPEKPDRLLLKKSVDQGTTDRKLIFRQSNTFVEEIPHAYEVLASVGCPNAANEIREALRDISRKPRPDKTGAIQHAMCALECIAREVTGERNLSLGRLIPHLGLTRPLDAVVSKLWGYASEHARHIREGQSVTKDEAELVVALTSSLCIFLAGRIDEAD